MAERVTVLGTSQCTAEHVLCGSVPVAVAQRLLPVSSTFASNSYIGKRVLFH